MAHSRTSSPCDTDTGGDERARIAGLGSTAEILVSSTVHDLVAGSDFEFAERGTHQLKGIPEPR